MAHYAHSVAAKSEDHWQPLADHLKAVAALAESRGGKFGASRAAFVAGLLHDLGKYTKQFQRRLDGGERVDHATAGARTIMERAAKPDRLCAELIAYAIAGHHGGLPDRRGLSGSLDARLDPKRELPNLAPVWQTELGPLPSGLAPQGFKLNLRQPGFQLSMLCRFVFSCLIDADHRDTEAFYAKAEGRRVDRATAVPLAGLKAKLDAHLAGMRRSDTDVNRLRTEVLD